MPSYAQIYQRKREKYLQRRIIDIYTEAQKEYMEQYSRYVYGWDEEENGNTIHHKGMFERKAEQWELFKLGAWRDADGNPITDKKEFNKWWKAQEGRSYYWLDIRNKMSQRVIHADEIATAIINGEMPKVYSVSFNKLGDRAMEEARKQGFFHFKVFKYSAKELEEIEKYRKMPMGIRFDMLDDRMVYAVLNQNNDVFQIEKLAIDYNLDESWTKQKLENQFAIGLLNDENEEQLARRFQTVINMKRSSAIRQARSALNNAKNCAEFDRMNNLYNRGCETTKYWIDVHDSVPPERQAHWDAGIKYTKDNAIPFGEDFIVGGEACQYPCDPALSGWNRWNCRCQLGIGDKFIFHSVLSEDMQRKANIRVEVR